MFIPTGAKIGIELPSYHGNHGNPIDESPCISGGIIIDESIELPKKNIECTIFRFFFMVYRYYK